MKKVLIINQGFTANIGDKAIQYALKRFFEDKSYDVKLAGFSYAYKNVDMTKTKGVGRFQQFIQDFHLGEKSEKIMLCLYKLYKFINDFFYSHTFGYFYSWIKSERKLCYNHINQIIDNFDLVIVGGGQLIATNTFFPFAFKTWSKFSNCKGKKKAVVGVGVEPSFSNYELAIYDKYFKIYNKIYARDIISVNRIKDLFGVNAEFIPDVAFLLRRYFYDAKIVRNNNLYILFPYDFKTYKRRFNKDANENEYLKFWIDKIITLYNSKKQVELMYTTPEDRLQAETILEKIEDEEIRKNVHIFYYETVEEFIKKLQTAKRVISARMHALILGMVAGCEVEAIKISDKLINFEKEYINSSHSVDDYCIMIENKLDELL